MNIFDDARIGMPTQGKGGPVQMRCPHCNVLGTFAGGSDFGWNPYGNTDVRSFMFAGPRFCPNPDCQRVVLVLLRGAELIYSAPPQTLDFNSAKLPEAVASSMKEAISCHAAGCYRAAALMVRRVLEEICLDRGATGKDLKARLGKLGELITLPKELLEGLDALRVLGNDAAHIEARIYDDIGKEEVEVAVELAKEILKATYQFADLLSRLKSLGKAPS